MDVAGFDWDRGNRTKCQKHGVSVAEIESLFRRPIMVAPDPHHSAQEERLKAVGTTDAGRHVFVAHAETARRRHAHPARERPLHAPQGGAAL
ncbi:BrnT family toxin [Rhodoplanes sp.]|uniref:BrnT family toxin n=1 Tax=Rhodoplanes sp. TaxID=1968906 RepID=UPI0025D48CD2|nr:BrnT family toxin [Rhodoplanes sp.]